MITREEFRAIYHNPNLRVTEVQKITGINVRFLTKVARHFGLKTRLEAGIRRAKKKRKKNWVCETCEHLAHCQKFMPIPFPCEELLRDKNGNIEPFELVENIDSSEIGIVSSFDCQVNFFDV